MNNPLRWKLAGYLVAIFVIGGVSGAVMALGVAREHAPAPRITKGKPASMKAVCDHMRHRLQQRLDLSAEQLQRVDPILQRTSAEMEAIHRETLERIEAVLDDSNRAIETELTEEQKVKLREMERERRHDRRKGGRSRPPC